MNKLTTWLRWMLSLIFIIILITSSSLRLYAQQTRTLSIEEVYQLARKNYPLIKQRDLIAKTKDYSVSNAAKGYLPVFSVNGQATYQSAVTTFPFHVPGITIPQFSRDQYKFYAEGDQVIYDGGVIKNQQETAVANEVVQQQNLEVQLYALYDRVNQLFFGALLEDEQLKENDLLQQDIQNGIDKAKAQVANGIAYRSSVDELSAQLLQTQQSRIDLIATRKSYLDMLDLFIDAKPGDSTILEKPAAPTLTDSITRPELLGYDSQKKIFDLQDKLLSDQLRPKISFFAQGGYGRPGLNFLSNNFEWYYLGGLRLNWNFGSLYTIKNQKRLLNINKNSLEIQKETFLFNTKISQRQQNENVQKYDSLLDKDDAIINLRASVKKAAYAQLENGVLSAHDYINQVNAEDQARQTKILHEMQLLQAQYSYQNIVGNINYK
ncbi:MAG TPA: TolC family protein [Hanamia sp.]|nr:TolC family protein [Hanamia sp.]